MCLPDFIEFKQVDKSSPLTGYRSQRRKISDDRLIISSLNQRYDWKKLEGPHKVELIDSGIYSYNNNYKNNSYNYYYYNNYYNSYYNNYNNYYNKNYSYNYYCLFGIINQWGKVAIHKDGYRSEYAKIDTLFNIRESDAEGTKEFLNWIKQFNDLIRLLAIEYECKVISWQDYKEMNK